METVYIGVDVGKTFHDAAVTTATGDRIFGRRVDQEEADLRRLLDEAATHGTPVLILDQSASIGVLPRAVAHELAIPVLYLPGSTFHHVANSFPGRTKTDRRDADIIATAGRTMPHAVQPLAAPSPQIADLKALNGHLADLNNDLRRDKNRLRSLLLQLHAPLERLIGPRLDQAGVLPLLAAYPTPAALRQTPDATLLALLKTHGSRRASMLIAELRAVLPRQTLVLPGTARRGDTVAYRAAQCAATLVEKRRVTVALQTAVDADETARLIASMPGFGPSTTATVLVETAGKTFASAAHLASYAGVAPTVRQSGTSTRTVRRSRTANTRLKDAMCWAAFNTIRSGPGKVQYAAKRNKGHWKAIIALARRRTTILYAMLRDGTPYHAPASPLALTKT